MKDYIYFAIRINIAVVLATMLLAIVIVPLLILMIVPLAGLFSLESGDIESVTKILSFIVFALFSYKAAHLVFKHTYKNSKLKKHLSLAKCILYSFVLGVVIDAVIYYFDPGAWNLILMVIYKVLTLLGFYFAGKSVDKSTMPQSPVVAA